MFTLLLTALTIIETMVVSGIGVEPAATESPDARVTSRDMTPGHVWIERLERPDRSPALRIDDVIAALELQDGMVIADIGAGAGAFTLPFARAVGPSGHVIAAEIWTELLVYIDARAKEKGIENIALVHCAPDDPMLPPGQADIAFFHDVFHNIRDRQAYLEKLASYLKPGGRIAIIEQEYDDPIAKRWDVAEDRITAEQVDEWMNNVGFSRVSEFDLFQGKNNPQGAGMPERWFVVYARKDGRH